NHQTTRATRPMPGDGGRPPPRLVILSRKPIAGRARPPPRREARPGRVDRMGRSHDESERRFLVELPLKVQGYDVDVVGIVSNIVYVRWLEDLRQAFCDAHAPTDAMMAQGFLPALGSTHVEYKRAIRFGDAVTGRIWFDGFRGQRWGFAFEIVANGR